MSQSRTFKAGILASGQFFTSLAQGITMVVLARLLSKFDYATYQQTMLAYFFVTPLLTLGLPQALYYFLPGEKERPRAVLAENLFLLGFMGAVFSLFLLFGGNRLLAWRFNNPALLKTLLILSPYPLFMLPISALSACLMARDKPKHVAIFNVLSCSLKLAIIISLILIWRTPVAAIIGTVVTAGIVLLPALKLMFNSCSGGSYLPSRVGMWSQLKYAIPLGLAGTMGMLSKSLDKVLVSSMCPPEQFAIYVNGAIEIPLIGILTGSVTAVLLPDVVRLYKQDNKAEALQLWKRAAAKCAMIILPVMCFLVTMAPEVIRVLFTAKYTESVHPFRVYLLLLPIRIVTWEAMLVAAGKSSWILYKTVISLLLNLVLSLIMVRQIGYIGAAIATVIVIYAWNIPFNMTAIWKLYNVPFWKILPYGVFLKIMLIAVFASCLCMVKRYLPTSNDLVQLAILTPVYTGTVLLMMLKFNLLKKSTLIAALKRIRF